MTKKYFLIINTAFQDKIVLALAQKVGLRARLTQACGVGRTFSPSGFLIDKLEIKTKFTHSEKLLPSIDKLLSKNKVILKEIKAIGAVRGPGSYTSLKIGLTIANVLGFALKVPVVGVKLSEFGNIKELVDIIYKKHKRLKTGKKERIILPFYGEKPYYER